MEWALRSVQDIGSQAIYAEVGVFRGTIFSYMTNGAQYFDSWGSLEDGYQVRGNKGDPVYGSWNSYELVFDSVSGGHFYWDALINGIRVEQIRNDELGYTGRALAGGETTVPGRFLPMPNHISTSARPPVLLQSQTIAWAEWTPTLMSQSGGSTATCTDLNVNWTYTNQFDNFTADGDITS